MTAALAASISLLAAACAHERVAWPPTATEVQHINEAAESNDWFRIEYVKPIPSQNLRVFRPIGIESVDGNAIEFRTASGETSELPTRLVTGVTVKDRGRGALAGTGIGVAAAAVELGAWYWLRSATNCNNNSEPYSGPGAPVGTGIDGDICRGTLFIGTAAVMILAGTLFGYLIGAPRTFHFGPDR